eukprot:3510719-Pleurochrysis_carterae.AAC.2
MRPPSRTLRHDLDIPLALAITVSITIAREPVVRAFFTVRTPAQCAGAGAPLAGAEHDAAAAVCETARLVGGESAAARKRSIAR